MLDPEGTEAQYFYLGVLDSAIMLNKVFDGSDNDVVLTLAFGHAPHETITWCAITLLLLTLCWLYQHNLVGRMTVKTVITALLLFTV